MLVPARRAKRWHALGAETVTSTRARSGSGASRIIHRSSEANPRRPSIHRSSGQAPAPTQRTRRWHPGPNEEASAVAATGPWRQGSMRARSLLEAAELQQERTRGLLARRAKPSGNLKSGQCLGGARRASHAVLLHLHLAIVRWMQLIDVSELPPLAESEAVSLPAHYR